MANKSLHLVKHHFYLLDFKVQANNKHTSMRLSYVIPNMQTENILVIMW